MSQRMKEEERDRERERREWEDREDRGGMNERSSKVAARIEHCALEHWIGSIPHGTGPLDRLALPRENWRETAKRDRKR